MNLKNNIFKSIITSVLGIIIVLVTVLLVFTGTMDWIWNGIAGCVIGAALIVSPDSLVEKISDFIGKFTTKKP